MIRRLLNATLLVLLFLPIVVPAAETTKQVVLEVDGMT